MSPTARWCARVATFLLLSLLATACGFSDPDEDGADQPDVAADPTLGPLPEEDTVDGVDVARYLGLWHEIASIPLGFQARCAATTATYGLVDADTISVLNRCRIGGLDGQRSEVSGEADVVDPATNAKLEVRFPGFGSSPYWVVDLAIADGDAPYEWAIVSTPTRNALWVLARTPQMSPARYDALVARLQTRGFEPERMRLTVQPAP